MRKLLIILSLAGLPLVLPATTYAASDKFHQQILPLNCVFEEVNDGLGSLYYLTPAECGVVVTPPQQNVPQPSQSAPVFVPAPYTQTYDPAQPLVGSLNVRAVLPWQPIVATVKGNGMVVVASQSDSNPTEDANLADAIEHLIGDIVRPTPAKVAVGITASLFIIVVLFLALI